MKLTVPLYRACVVGLAMFMALTFTALEPHVVGQQSTSRIDRAVVRETVESVASVVIREYFDVSVGARVGASLRQWLYEGRYANAETLESLAAMLTRDLLAATQDKHLAANAMRFLQYTDALILDMRSNSGGSADTAALLASYLFATAKLPLFEIIPRSGQEGRWYATESPPLPGRNGTRPVYVLTAERTFSAGEGFAFILQERRRAEVIGERTAGAANPGRPYAVSAGLELTVPNGQVRAAVSGRNWEGVGVIPDVSVTASDALRVGHIRALRGLLQQAPSGLWHEALKRQIAALEERR